MSFEEAYKEEEERINALLKRQEKIRAFEAFLVNKGARCEQSNVSESRYYSFNCKKYRFSGHVYPTGSMTNELLGVVDLAADPELIDNIVF